jgi:hypothetical protein
MADLTLLERTFYDITDTVGLPAPSSGTATKSFDPNGENLGTSYMTPNTVNSSATSSAVSREIWGVEIVSPVNNAGQFEDLREVYLVLDDVSTQHYINLSGDGNLLMTPWRETIEPTYEMDYKTGRVRARTFIPFGTPLWLAAVSRMPNMALYACCPKFKRTLAVTVSSAYGVTGAVSGGYRIRVVGFEYKAQHLAAISQNWNSHVELQTFRRTAEGKPPLVFDHGFQGPITIDNFTSLPGGLEQGGIKVMPRWAFARNNTATESQAAFALTNLTSLEGGSGYVEDTFQDLGLPFDTKNAMVVLGYGAKGVPLAAGQSGSATAGENLSRAGWILNGDTVPSESGGNDGFYMSENLNDLTWGATNSNHNRVRPIPPLKGEPLVVYRDTAVPFIGANGSSVPEDVAAVAIHGYQVEGV